MEQEDNSSGLVCVGLDQIIQKCNDFGVKFKACYNADEEADIIELAKNYLYQLLEILKDTSSDQMTGIQPTKLAEIINCIAWWPNGKEKENIDIMIARVLIYNSECGGITFRYCTPKSLKDLADRFRYWSIYKHMNVKEIRKAVGVIANIINIEFEESNLEHYSIETLSGICDCFVEYFNKNEHRYLPPIILAVKHIAEKFEMHTKINKLGDSTGECISVMVKACIICFKHFKSNLFLNPIISIAKYIIEKFNEDKLTTFSPYALGYLVSKLPIKLGANDEGNFKSAVIALMKATESRSFDELSEFSTQTLVYLIFRGEEWLKTLENEKMLIRSLMMKTAAVLEAQTSTNKSSLASCGVGSLAGLALAFKFLSKQNITLHLDVTMLEVAKLIIRKHEISGLRYLDLLYLSYFVGAFSKYREAKQPDYLVIMSKAILSIARTHITKLKKRSKRRSKPTVLFEDFFYAYGIWKEFDEKESLRYAIEFISNILLAQYENLKLTRYSMQQLCLITIGLAKWYDDFPSSKKNLILIAKHINSLHSDLLTLNADELSNLSRSFIDCYKFNDENSQIFKTILYEIARIVVKMYDTNQLEEYNPHNLLNLINAFGSLLGDDDGSNSIRNAILRIAKKLWSLDYSEIHVVLQGIHEFAYTFMLWQKEDDGEKSLHLGLTCIEQFVSQYFTQTDDCKLTVHQLSILSQAFYKLAKFDITLNKSCLAIAKLIVRNCDYLLEFTSEQLANLAKAFSLWYENDDLEESFKRASEAVAYTVIKQLKDADYACDYSLRNLACLAFSFSKWSKDTNEGCMKEAILSISTYVSSCNNSIEQLSTQLKHLAKLSKAYMNWTDDIDIIKSILNISVVVNTLNKEILNNCRHKYLSYFIKTFSKVFTSFNKPQLKILILASSNIIKAHNTQDLKTYDRGFLSYLDEHLSKFSEEWEINESVLIIRQEMGIAEVVNGKTVLEIFEIARRTGVNELREMMVHEPENLVTLAVSCSSFLHCDDRNKTLRGMINKIAKVVLTFSRELILFDKEGLADLLVVFSKCFEEKPVQNAIYILATIIPKYGGDASEVFQYSQLEKITRTFRKWCDKFPSKLTTESDKALEYVTCGLKKLRETRTSIQ